MKLAEKKMTRQTRAISHRALKVYVNLLIDRRFLSEFTWTGKSTPGIRKIPFQDQKEILELLYILTSKTITQEKYTDDEFHGDCVDRIMKFAYE